MTSEEDKENLLADQRSKEDKEPEKKRSKLAARAEYSQECAADPTKGRYKVRLAECVEVVALGDYGADYSAVSKHLLQQLTNAG
jgi:hypothetical protein